MSEERLIGGAKSSLCSVAKTASHGTPESGNKSGVEKSDQMKSYNPVTSKLVYNQSTGPAFGNMEGVQTRDPAFENKAADAAVAPTVLVQKGHSGSQSSDGPGDLDCDSNNLEGELVNSILSWQSIFHFEKLFRNIFSVASLLNVSYSVR